MGGVSFEMDMDKLQRSIGVAMARANRSQDLMEQIGEALITSVSERFRSGVGPDGKKWKPSQRAIKDGGKTLVKDPNGGLSNSILYEVSPQMVVIGTRDIPYARIHQLGGKAGRGLRVNLPARPYLGIDDEDRTEIKHMMVEHLKSMFGV